MLNSVTEFERGEIGRRLSPMVPDANRVDRTIAPTATKPVTSRTFYGGGTAPYERQIAPFDRRLDRAVEAATAKISVIDATVKSLGETFLLVSASPQGVPVDIEIPLELCPADLRYVGTPVAISVDTQARYSRLRVDRREKKKEFSADFKKRFAAMAEWADSL